VGKQPYKGQGGRKSWGEKAHNQKIQSNDKTPFKITNENTKKSNRTRSKGDPRIAVNYPKKKLTKAAWGRMGRGGTGGQRDGLYVD